MLMNQRIMSARDNARLSTAVAEARNSWLTYAPYLELFRAELRRARTMPPGDVPADVVTMNSRFAVTDPRTGEAVSYTLVYPDSADASGPQGGRLSVLSPMGMAVLGARVGEEVCWHGNDGPEVGRISRLLYQPESAGDEDR
jgi:regulator of nucleoside diphosphate kinase